LRIDRPLKLAVIGDPVEHSASPALHRAFMLDASLTGTYEAIRVCAGDGAKAIERLRAAGYTGLNVTTPLKEEAYARADTHDAAALAAGSVNTLVFGERIAGHNTDGLGAIGACHEAGLQTLAGAIILVLGTGPTARSCVAAFIAAGATTYIWNRTPAKAHELAQALAARLWTPESPPASAAISALPPSATLNDPALVATLKKTPILIDANYGPRATLGATLNRPTNDGHAMLKASAQASFALFTAAQAPPTT
jgi:shikimate dehydrogenase